MSVHALQLKHERWKNTDMSVFDKHVFVDNNHDARLTAEDINVYRLPQAAIMIVMVNGRLQTELSDLAQLPAGVVVQSLQAAKQTQSDWINQHVVNDISAAEYPYAALNLETERDGLFVHVPANIDIQLPLHVLSIIQSKEAARVQTQNVCVFEQNSRVTLLQEYVSMTDAAQFNNVVTLVTVEQNAQVQWIKHQHENTQAVHMENYFVKQAVDSEFNITHLSMGAQFSRDDIRAVLQASGAICRTSGFYHTKRDGQYVDHHIDILHLQPHTQSDMLYKGIIDKKSRAVFNGKLYVEKGAQKTNAVQGNHHILLSPSAEAYAKPELEIYEGDIKCKHGVTTGQLDQDALFYLRARGINEQEARTILLNSFAEDVLQRIQNQGIQQHIRQQVML